MARSEPENSNSDDGHEDHVGGYDDLASNGPIFSATRFDHYFAQVSKPSRTSTNTFSAQTTPLTSLEYSTAIVTTLTRLQAISIPVLNFDSLFFQFVFRLDQDFNLLLYGAGSKRHVLNSFAAHVHNTKAAHVIVINASAPNFDYKDMLSSVERISQCIVIPTTLRGTEGQMARIAGYFNSRDDHSHNLYLIIHNIDAPAFRTSKATSALSSLCANPCIHVTASVDNIAFPVRCPLEDLLTRNPSNGQPPTSHGYTWLWHDVTTLQSYDFELSSADPSSLTGASQGSSTASRSQTDTANNPMTLLTPESARHILVSVTQKAKKLFALLATRQAQVMGDDGPTLDPKEIGMEYSTLFSLARENFIATNDTSLQALMSEFKTMAS